MAVSDQVIARKKRKAAELLNKNRLADAKVVYLDLIKRNAGDAEAWFMLGTVESRMGNPAAAEKAMGKALEADKTLAEAWLGLGRMLELQGRVEDAVRIYLRALGINSNLAEVHAALGRLYLGMMVLPQSIEHFRHAIKLGLRPPKLLTDYADALHNRGELKEALAIYQQLVAEFPADAELHSRLANLYIQFSELEQAHQHFLAAIKIVPGHIGAVTGEIKVLRMQKRFDEVLAKIKPLFDSVTDNLPLALAYAELCHIDGECGRVIQRVEQLLEKVNYPPQEVAVAGFKLGKLYDAQGGYDKAFAWYRRANDLKKGGYNCGAADATVDAIIEGYSKERLAAAARADHGDARPVFIVGMPRSGSSLIEQILASHPEVYGAGELPDMADILREARGGSQDVDLILHETERFGGAGLNQMAAKYSARLDEISAGERFVTDKMPNNFFRLGFISRLFPHSKIIHVRRDPVDTCLSCYFQDFAAHLPYTYDFDSLGNYYKNYLRLMEHWRQVLPLSMLELDYEKLVADQEGETRRLLAFLGLDWDDHCLQFYKGDRVTVTASNAQVQRPIYNGSVARWKKYEKHLALLKAALS